MKKGVVYYLDLIILSIIFLVQLAIFISFILIFLTPEDFCLGTFCLSLLGLLISGISFLLLKLAKNDKTMKKILSIICSIILVFLITIFDIFLGFAYCFESLKEIKPKRERYSLNINRMSVKDYRIKHFPTDIPKNAKEYYFLIGDSGLQGEQISYLKFYINKEYIDTIIKKNNIFKKIKFKDVKKYYSFIDNEFGVKEEDKNGAWVYILKNENNDTNYTSGFITTESNQIIFFHSNFSLKF